MHLVVTVKTAKKPNTQKELATDMRGLAFSGHSPYLATCSAVTSSVSQPLQRSAATGRTPHQAMQILLFAVRYGNRRQNSCMKQFLLLFLLIPWLCACDRLSDTEVKALKCELWRDNGGGLNRQIYRDLIGKTKCITTNNFGEMLTIKGSKGIPIQCDPKEQKSFLQEVNSICDALLNQKASN